MIKLKKIHLVNYCGYRDFELDLTDGDDVRKLWPELGLSEQDRSENVARMADLAAGIAHSLTSSLIVVACIAPYKNTRDWAINRISEFAPCYEVYLTAPLEERISRDPKGLYKKAINGEITGLTGYNGIYEEPTSPDLVFDTNQFTALEIAEKILQEIK